jgi:hypothetical protein
MLQVKYHNLDQCCETSLSNIIFIAKQEEEEGEKVNY